MSKARRFPAIVVLLLGSSLLLPVPAHAVELTGAWANQADLCSSVKKGNGVVFAELSDLYGSGFIIEGNRIRGKAAKCTIAKQGRRYSGANRLLRDQHYELRTSVSA